MSVSADRPQVEGACRRLTVADLAALPSELPSGDVRFELDNGRLVSMSPPGNVHGWLQASIGAELKQQGEKRGFGKAYSEVGVILWRNPDRVIGADNAFIAAQSLPERESPEGYLETIPELMVEIRSKNDTRAYLLRKIEDCLTAGAQVAWLVDPLEEAVTVYRRAAEPQDFRSGDVLTLEPLIPGFRLPVTELFRD
jgi:Uma2 family endonuclease